MRPVLTAVRSIHSAASQRVHWARLALCAFSLGAAASVQAASPVLDALMQSRTLRIGHRMSSMPLSYVLPGEKAPTGYATDICLALADGIKRDLNLPNLTIEWVPTTSAQRFQFAMAHKIDLECATTTVTSERRQKYAEFTAPFFIAGAGVLAAADLKATKLADLNGKTIAFQKGATAEKVVKLANESGIKLNVLLVDNATAGLAAIAAGKAQAVMDDDVVLANARAQMADPKQVTFFAARHTIEPLAVMFPKDDPKWVQMVDRHYARLIGSGEIERLYRKWFMQPIPPKGVNLNLPPSKYLKETFRLPIKLETDANVVKLQ